MQGGGRAAIAGTATLVVCLTACTSLAGLAGGDDSSTLETKDDTQPAPGTPDSSVTSAALPQEDGGAGDAAIDSAPPAGASFVANGGFETGHDCSPWAALAGSTTSLTSPGHASNTACHVCGASNGIVAISTKGPSNPKAGVYQIDGWVRTSSETGSIYLYADRGDANGWKGEIVASGNVSAMWQHIQGTSAVPEGMTYTALFLALRNAGESDCVDLDDVAFSRLGD
jgi:hypothetical protein